MASVNQFVKEIGQNFIQKWVQSFPSFNKEFVVQREGNKNWKRVPVSKKKYAISIIHVRKLLNPWKAH